MAILRKLFGRANARAWDAETQSECRGEILRLFEATTSLATKQLADATPEAIEEEPGRNIYKAILCFEAGCYLMFRLDLHMYRGHEQVRNEVVGPLLLHWGGFVGGMLANTDVAEIADERIELYGAAIRSGREFPQIVHHLKQVTFLATGKKAPARYDVGEPVVITDFLRSSRVEFAWIAIEKHLVPPFLKAVSQVIAACGG